MKFTATMHGHEISGDCVNPGEWFGKVWVVEIGCGCSSIFLAIEADTEIDAIDVLADSEQYGHLINDPDNEENEDVDVCRAGNDSHAVNLDNVLIHGIFVENGSRKTPFEQKEGCSNLLYCVGNISPIEWENR